MDATISHRDAQPTAYTSVSTENMVLRLCMVQRIGKILCNIFCSEIQLFIYFLTNMRQ